MLAKKAKRLTKYCRTRVGDKLRSVTIYNTEDIDIVYQREGLRENYSEAQASALVRSARELNTTLHEANVREAPLGEPIAGIYSFEDAFVMQLPEDSEAGIVATFDADIGAELAGFIQSCKKAMEG